MPKDIDDLEEKITKLKQQTILPINPETKSLNKARNLVTEFVVTIIVSGLFGYFLDRWLKTAPIFLLICLIFGFISGLCQIYKKTKDYV